MNTWVQVDKLQDGERVNAETLNKPVDQLASRTDYLKRRLGTILEDGVQSSLVLPNVKLDGSDTFEIGNVVFHGENGFRRAQAKMSLYDDYTADESAFTVGILISKTEFVGDVLIYGKLKLDSSAELLKSHMFESGETFRPGRYYLSATEPGKLSSHPNGPLIYVGSFQSDESSSDLFPSGAAAYVNPQFLDIGTSHVHRAYPLVARPAGYVESGHVIGYLPVGAFVSSGSSGSSQDDSSSSSPESNRLPSLVFDGTWTSVSDVPYVFTLGSANTWGNVTLSWNKNGESSPSGTVKIPAPDVFVDLDNGLRVKVRFPEATKSTAFTVLSEEERTWSLTFPDHGKGWVDHCVEAVANINRTVDPSRPIVHAVIRGRWPQANNQIYVRFPNKAFSKTITELDTSVKIGTVRYQFVRDGESPSTGNIPVTKGATVSETLSNLLDVYEQDIESPNVLVYGNKLVTLNYALEGASETWSWGSSGIGVVGGTVPIMVVYDKYGYLLGDVVANHDCYTPARIGDLDVTVFARNATAGARTNYTLASNTVLLASAYDPRPDAAYDYVMGLHPDVDAYFPPVPAQSAGLFVNGVEMENAALFPDNPTYAVGPRTLHWMEDAQGRLPWPADVSSHDEYVDPSVDKTMAFYFNVGFQCATGPVTSVVPAPDAPIKLYAYGTNKEAYTGDLMIDAAFDFAVADAGVQGYLVAKQGRGGKLLAGPVVERIKAGNGITVTQPDGCPLGQGTVTIGLDDGSMRNTFGDVALENAKQEKIGLFPYVSLLGWGESNNIPSAFTAMMRVPSNLDDREYKLQLRMVMFGTAGYEGRRRAAGVQLEYNILPDYTDTTSLSLKNGLLIPDSPRLIAVPLGHQVGDAYKYVAYDPFVATTEVDDTTAEADVRVPFSSVPIPYAAEFSSTTPSLRPGYLLAIRVSRIANPDTVNYASYTNPIGFLSMEWTLQEA